jgi:hypothetical protein
MMMDLSRIKNKTKTQQYLGGLIDNLIKILFVRLNQHTQTTKNVEIEKEMK